MSAQKDRKGKTTASKPIPEDLVNTLSSTMMNAREIAVYMRVSMSTANKHMRSLRDDGLVMIDHSKPTARNGYSIPYYRAMTADETAEYRVRQGGDYVERSNRGDGQQAPVARWPAARRDSLVLAFFGAGPARNMKCTKVIERN